LVEKGEDAAGNTRFVTYQVVKGTFKGMGCTEQSPENWEEVSGLVTTYPENEFIRNTLFSALARGAGSVLEP
jgi:hypothetical protein